MVDFNSSFPNGSHGNGTTPDPAWMGFSQYGATGYFLVVLTLLAVLVALVLNVVVIKSLNQLNDDKLKIKFLVKNAIIGDLLLSMVFALRALFVVTDSFENEEAGIVAQCVNIFYGFYAYFASFYQIFGTMIIAIDRLYSVFNPIVYHTMRYNTTAKVLIVLTLTGISFGISLPTVLLKIQPGKPLVNTCLLADDRNDYSVLVLPYLLIASVLFTLLIYCGIFFLLTCYRRLRRDRLGETTEKLQSVRRTHASLAVTFFTIHLTYVLLYIPANLFFSSLTADLRSRPKLYHYLQQTVLLIYLCNTIVDPLIYILRIRSVRAGVRALLCKSQGRGRRDYSTSERETPCQGTHMSTISS